MPAGSRPAIITATVFNVSASFPAHCELLFSDVFTAQKNFVFVNSVSTRFALESICPLSSSLLVAAAVRSGVLHFLLGLPGFSLFGLQGFAYAKFGLPLPGVLGPAA